jgi:hypothetical protein
MKEEIKYDGDDLMKVFNFGAVARVPIIEENLIVNTRTPWVYYGVANLAAQELIRLYNTSPTHRACITSKWFGVRGEGIKLASGEDDRLMMVNSLGDTLYDVYAKASLDFILYGGFALNVVWRRDREQGFEIYYIDFSKLRAGKTDMNDRIEDFYYCADWAYPKKFVPRRIPAFNSNTEEPSQIFYYTTHSCGNNYYPTPTYWGAATAIATQVEVFNWHYNNIINGLSPSLFVSLMGVPAPEQREEIYKNMMSKYGGSNQAGKLFLTFSDSRDMAPEITPIASNSSDKMWMELNDMVQQAILTSHQISSPELLGIITPGGLGTPDHIQAQDHFFNLVIKPLQREILTVFDKILLIRDRQPAEIIVDQFQMVTIADQAPIKVEEINETKDVAVDEIKDETIQQP